MEIYFNEDLYDLASCEINIIDFYKLKSEGILDIYYSEISKNIIDVNCSTAVVLFCKYKDKYMIFGKTIEDIVYLGFVIPDDWLQDSIKYFDRKNIKKGINGATNLCELYESILEDC